MRGRSLAEVAAGAVVLAVAAAFLAYALLHSGRAGAVLSGPTQTFRARFDRVDGVTVGSDVRIAGVKVGSVVDSRIDPQTFLAVLTLRVDGSLRLPDDTSAEITSEGLLGGRYVALVPGGSERILRDGAEITITQSAVSLESLLGRFIFSVTQMNQAREQQQQPEGSGAAAPAPAR
ncbi:outer membrane lipid asymmetry maintenance protein MlaD [Caldovatus aquaticus]|uniref:Outer membrane lipid asymmetry maintenance protein MlaD n=1 Tax=Caldovatus aquaticus TaxID=2865671 RepID=A0ABS7F7J4_9PROT|nr:outer membrane lipid asymmetry maintenance protein MlaD [Caldovatus aquaticus]